MTNAVIRIPTLRRMAFDPAKAHDRHRCLAEALGDPVLDEVEHVLVVEKPGIEPGTLTFQHEG